jgi:hypothetical protein
MFSKGKCTNNCRQLIMPQSRDSDTCIAKLSKKFKMTRVFIPDYTEVVDAVRVASTGVLGSCGGMLTRIAVPLGIDAPLAAVNVPLNTTWS